MRFERVCVTTAPEREALLERVKARLPNRRAPLGEVKRR